MKQNRSTVILALVFAAGLCLLLYPTLSDWWNSFHQSRAISSYASAVSELDDEKQQAMYEEARLYNEALLGFANRYHPTEAEHRRYLSTLSVTDDGMMCYVEIPSIRVQLPVYHGVDDAVLQVACGHIEGTSLPVGGASTHTVISGHRGLPSARLLSDIDQLREGDTFMLHTLGETLTYEVDQIRIVEPDELDDLEIEEGKDLCTLVTCTPYGVNTHRLLVRGHRVANDPDAVRVAPDALQVDPAYVAPFVAAPMVVALLALLVLADRRRRRLRAAGRAAAQAAQGDRALRVSGSDARAAGGGPASSPPASAPPGAHFSPPAAPGDLSDDGDSGAKAPRHAAHQLPDEARPDNQEARGRRSER